MSNNDLAQILRSIAVYEEMQNEPFKARAYERAALTIEELSGDIKDLYTIGGKVALNELPGIGPSIAQKIEEYVKTGEIKAYEKMEHKIPVNLKELYGVEGLGPKKIKLLYDKLKITNLKELEAAAKSGKIAKITHLGKKSQENILRGIGFLKKGGNRKVLGWILNFAQKIEDRFQQLEGVKHAQVTGSIRRRQETIGDIDLLVVTTKPELAQETFIKLPQVTEVKVHGPGRSEVRLNNNMDADLRVIPPESYGAALIYFTGDKAHNIELRKRAIAKGWKLNEYGLYKGKKMIAGKTEEEIYKKLGLDWIPPEIRTMHGEIEAAQKHQLPKLLPYGSVKGDLQVQTEWTDGTKSIETMARAAAELGRDYIAITDHTQSLTVTNGLNEKRLEQQGKEIDKLNKEISQGKFGEPYKHFKILKGAEINILKDGSFDIANEALKKLDVVAAAVHSHFRMTREEMTQRIIKAMHHPYLNILFHPTGRIINKRPPYEVDMEKIITAAKKYNIALELDCFPERMDLKDEHVRIAVEAGVKIVIDSDAHAPEHLKFIKFGEATARRGWAEKKDVINTKNVEEVITFFRKKR